MKNAYNHVSMRLALMSYQRTQDYGLSRGTDGQVYAVCKRIDSWFAFNALSELERQVVFLHFLQGVEQKAIAQKIGKSAATVSRIVKGAIEKMVDFINNQPDRG